MKRSCSGKVKDANSERKLDVDLFGRPIKKDGSWDAKDGDDLLIFTQKDVVGKKRVAGFDMDGTLIKTKSGKVFPVDCKDWKLFNEGIPGILRQLYEDGFKIVIFTNQKGIKVGKVDKTQFKRKIEAIVAKLGVPVQVFVAVGEGIYRKPNIGMWNEMVSMNDNVMINLQGSFYVGDAAGRQKTKIRPKKDHSWADRFFAANVGIAFHTPEQFFEKMKGEEPCGQPAFDPKLLFDDTIPLLDPSDTKIPSDVPEIIVMTGFPGSGKSTFSRKLEKEYGYKIVNRDTLRTWQKCVVQAKHFMKDGKSVIVDNTNPDKESRKRYTDLAKELNVRCRCFKMACNLAQAEHNIRYRSLSNENAINVGVMVLRVYSSKYQEPEKSEGFEEVVTVNFKPEFETDELRKLYSMYLVE